MFDVMRSSPADRLHPQACGFRGWASLTRKAPCSNLSEIGQVMLVAACGIVKFYLVKELQHFAGRPFARWQGTLDVEPHPITVAD